MTRTTRSSFIEVLGWAGPSTGAALLPTLKLPGAASTSSAYVPLSIPLIRSSRRCGVTLVRALCVQARDNRDIHEQRAVTEDRDAICMGGPVPARSTAERRRTD